MNYNLKSISIAVTKRCNLSCKYCSRNAGSDKLDFTLENIKLVIDSLKKYKKHEVKVFAISGGEPLLHPNFYEILDLLVLNGFGITLNTNLVLFSELELQKLKNYPIFKIVTTLDGIGKTHDEIRGKGSFDKTINNIEQAVKLGFNIFVKTVLRKENLSELNDLILLCKKLGVKKLGAHRICAIGRAKNLGDKLSFIEYKSYLENAYIFAKKINFEFAYDDPLKIFVEPQLVKYKDQLIDEIAGCSAGKYMLNILTDGSVIPCPAFEYPVANIFDQSIEDIFENNSILNKLRDRKSYCDCKYANICGGCRSRAYSKSKNIFGTDPLCNMKCNNNFYCTQ